MSREYLISVVYKFLGYLFQEKESELIKKVFLFGSVARGDFDKNSDIDVFIDSDKELGNLCARTLKKFYNLEGEKLEYKGISNKISIKSGNMEEWGLKEVLERDSLVLYSNSAINLSKSALFSISPITDQTKRIRVMRNLFGRVDYKTSGIIGNYKGKRIAPTVFLVDYNGLREVASYLTKEKVKFEMREIWN